MLREASYTDKFKMLESWMTSVLETTKKEVKRDHLKKNFNVLKTEFPGRQVSKLTVEELAPVYWKWITDGDEDLGEWLANQWIVKHSDVYDLFASELSQVASDFDAIEELEEQFSENLISKSCQAFGAPTTYLFSVLNSVVFPKSSYQELEQQAKEQVKTDAQEAEQAAEALSLEQAQKRFEQDLKRIENRYEKKLAGLQRKYEVDTASLKKQISNLQRKLEQAAVN